MILLLALAIWLGWTAVSNTPFMPGGLPAIEGWFWPIAIFLASIGFAVSTLSDLKRKTRWRPVAAIALTVLPGGLALRLAVLPLLPTMSPLTLIGLREGLALMALIFGAYAVWVWRQAISDASEHD